jgi:hypothetical protein
MMQAAPDIMLGWERIETIDGEERDFYIRQLWDAKGSVDVELMEPRELEAYGKICGWTLARAHARSGDRIAIAAYLGKGDAFDRAMASFFRDVRRPERSGLRDARGRSRGRPHRRRAGSLIARVLGVVVGE